MKLVIIYYSGYENTKIVAEHIQIGASKELEQEAIVSTLETQENFELLHQADNLGFLVRQPIWGQFQRSSKSLCITK